MTIVELVRHAKAGSRDGWTRGPDRERPLSATGREQARHLVDDLAAGQRIVGLYTSPLARCRQTLEPLADVTDLPLIDREPLAETPGVPVVDAGSLWVGSAWLAGRAAGLLDHLVAQHRGGRIVCCSHGDVLSALLAMLAGRDGVDLVDTHLKKGARATLRFDGSRCAGVTVGEPPRAHVPGGAVAGKP